MMNDMNDAESTYLEHPIPKHVLQLTRRKNIRNNAILDCLLKHVILGREVHRQTVFTEWSLLY